MMHREHKNAWLSILILFSWLNHELVAQPIQSVNKNVNVNNHILVGMGIILDMESRIGKSIHWCISMAISDFYALNNSYKTRIAVHTRDSKGDPVKAVSAVDDLLKKVKVQAIIGPDMYLQSKLLSLFSAAQVPVFSFASLSSMDYPCLFQIKQDESTMAKSIAALVESYKWRKVIFVHEDTDDGREILPYLAESFQDKNILISYRSAISATASPDDIIEELRKLMTFYTTIVIVHMSPSLASSLFLNAKRLGMVTEQYAWILTDKTVDLFRSTNFEVIESLQGALGLRSYVPLSARLHNLTERWHRFLYRKYTSFLIKEVPVPALWAYDTIWALAESIEKVGVPHTGTLLLLEVSKSRFNGISGEFQVNDRKLISNGYEVMNAVHNGEKSVGYWTKGIRRAQPLVYRDNLDSSLGTDTIIWPGGSKTAPKGWVLRATPSKRLKIGVVVTRDLKYFADVDYDVDKNSTTVTGFSVDVFNACIRELPYEVPYTFISFYESFDGLVEKVYNKEIDAVVGDSTILANRSEFVDFTATYTDLGVGTLARIKKEDMWFFLKALDVGLWLTAIAFLILTGFVVWAIEYMNQESEYSPTQRIGTIFWLILSTIFFAERDKLSSNLSKLVMFIWLFVVLILITSYTATLTSMLTVEQFKSISKGGVVGFQYGSFLEGVTVSNLHFEDQKQRPYKSYSEYAHALSKHGDADAIVDEIPYIKMFLSKYPGDYALVSTKPITSGFAFFFQKGSPLVEDISRVIAEKRFDGTLESLENKWFENRSSDPSRNSTIPHALKLNRFGGLFIISGITSTLALTISLLYLFCAKMEVQNIISLLVQRDLMSTIRFLLHRNVVRI